MHMIKKFSVESILVMLLFIIFTASIGILIVQGRTSYESIIESKNANEELRIAFAYIDKKIKQNDRIDGITMTDNPFNEYGAIKITHFGLEEGYYTTLFFYNDGLYEEMTTADEAIQIELSEKIISLNKPITISYDKTYQLVHLNYDTGESMTIHVKSKVVTDYEK